MSATTEPLRISIVDAEQILDSRGHPTVHVEVTTRDGEVHHGYAPSGASTGDHEAHELRDEGEAFGGRGVAKAISVVATLIEPMLCDRGWMSIADVDDALEQLDGTGRFARIGSNTSVAVSTACARAFAHDAELPLYEWIGEELGTTPVLPVPHFNVVNGGAHAANGLAFQEFLIAPTGAKTMADAVRMGAAVYSALEHELRSRFGSFGVGDEGGFAPDTDDERQVLDLLVRSVERTGLTPGSDIKLAVDAAANSFYDGRSYRLRGRPRMAEELLDRYVALLDDYPIWSLEDPFDESDRAAWIDCVDRLGGRAQILGDDIFVTDDRRIRTGAEEGIANAALIKPNQIGTVSRTFDALEAARQVGFASMISHRSGETSDTFIADLAVGSASGQIKAGAPARGERVAKYNRLTRIAALDRGLRYAHPAAD